MRLRRRRERSESPEVAPTREKRIRSRQRIAARAEKLPEHARVLGSIRYADVASRAQRGDAFTRCSLRRRPGEARAASEEARAPAART